MLQSARFLMRLHARPASSAVAVEDETGRVLVVKAHYKPYWTFPGGWIDKGETVREAAVREVKEEVGLDLDAGSLSLLTTVDRISSIMHTYQFIFTVTVKSSVEKDISLQAVEIADWRWVTKEEVISGAQNYSAGVERWAQGSSEPYVEQMYGNGL